MGNEAYQERDAAFFDYQLFDRFDFQLRGPEWPIDAPADFNIIGSARVFGCFVEKSMTAFLAERHGITARNFGTAGGNPYMFLRRPELLEYLSTSKAMPIIQVCGADGHTNDWFTRITGRTMKVKADGLGVKVGSRVRAGMGYRTAFKERPFEEVVEQIRKGQDFLLEDYKELKKALGRPAVVMYFSDRPARPLNKRTYRDLFTFPHCVDLRMWEELQSIFDYSLEIVSSEGMPFEVTNGTTSVRVDRYPSESMHRYAAEVIAEHRDAMLALADGPAKPVKTRRRKTEAVAPAPRADAPASKGEATARKKEAPARKSEAKPRKAEAPARQAAGSARKTPADPSRVEERRRKAAEARRQRREAANRTA
ncbi:DUF6473 family protein [Acuticoccus sediminis]|uniref:DUF6473 family protein n=1 Tax=Acuticoccus sediminis TaxID=2184697 RepID=UPI001CFE006E|nr:DUF6473 family protein [Acuticoccus sediminis]